MRPATAAADASQTVITSTTTRRVAADVPTDTKTPDLWEYLRAIKPNDWPNHMLYLYRVEPAPNVPVLKCQQYMTLSNGQQVNVADQEEVEFALLQHYGGKVFRLIVKRGSQWMTQGRITIDAPPRAITIPLENGGGQPGAPTIAGAGMGDTATIAGKAIDTIAGQEHQAVQIGMNALTTAANVVRSFGEARPSGGDEMTRQLMTLMMERLSQDPMEQMIKFFTVMREMGSFMSGGGAGAAAGMPADITQKLFGVMFDRFVNPAPSGAPVSASAELVRQLPQIGMTAVEGVTQFRMAMEAQRDTVRMQTQVRPGPGPQLISTPPPPSPTAAAVPPPTNGAPSMEFMEKKIIEILSQPNLSAVQAADDVLTFLDQIDERIPAQLAAMGETGLLQLFQTQPLLKPATQNSARLVEFIRAFLKMHAEDQTAGAGEPPKQSLPN